MNVETFDANRPIGAITVKELCHRQQISMQRALPLFQAGIVWGFCYRNRWYCSPALPIKKILDKYAAGGLETAIGDDHTKREDIICQN